MKDNLLSNLDKIHTTKLGINRIKNNLSLDDDAISYCKNVIQNSQCVVSKNGKNYYCKINNIVITINSNSYTIITAHKGS